MKAVVLGILIAMMIGPGQKSGDVIEVPMDQEFQLRAGQEIAIQGTNLKIKFASVLEDSRCPEDVECVWQGNGKVNLDLRESNKKAISVTVNTGITPREAEFRQYTVKLIKLAPNTRSNRTITQDQYEATVIVSKVKKAKKPS